MTKQRKGFSLIEVTLALGLTVFCLLAIFGLIPVGLKNNQAATEQTRALGILSAVASDLRATPVQEAFTRQFSVSVPKVPMTRKQSAIVYFKSDGEVVAASAPDSHYRLTVNFSPDASGGDGVFADLKISWPASADPADAAAKPRPAGFAQFFVVLDRT